MWKVEGIDEEEDLDLGSIDEDPALAVQGGGLRCQISGF